MIKRCRRSLSTERGILAIRPHFRLRAKKLSLRMFILKSLTVVLTIMCLCVVRSQFVTAQNPSPVIGERPALQEHVNQTDIENGAFRFNQLLAIGESIFAARWTKLDGQGRPAATGSAVPTKRDRSHDPGFLRTSGTDATYNGVNISLTPSQIRPIIVKGSASRESMMTKCLKLSW